VLCRKDCWPELSQRVAESYYSCFETLFKVTNHRKNKLTIVTGNTWLLCSLEVSRVQVVLEQSFAEHRAAPSHPSKLPLGSCEALSNITTFLAAQQLWDICCGELPLSDTAAQTAANFLCSLYLNMSPRPALEFTYKSCWEGFVVTCMKRLQAVDGSPVPVSRLLQLLVEFLSSLHAKPPARSKLSSQSVGGRVGRLKPCLGVGYLHGSKGPGYAGIWRCFHQKGVLFGRLCSVC
jgi:hypothetical protein